MQVRFKKREREGKKSREEGKKETVHMHTCTFSLSLPIDRLIWITHDG